MGDPSLGLRLSQEVEFTVLTTSSLTAEEVCACSWAHACQSRSPNERALMCFLPVFPLAARPGLSVALQCCGSAGGLKVPVRSNLLAVRCARSSS